MTSYKTPVEHFVKGVLRTQGIKSLPKIFLQKALALIDFKLSNPCCTDDDATVDLITRRKHVFTDTIESMLRLLPKNGNTQSLQRTRDLIVDRIYCCELGTVNFTIGKVPSTAGFGTISISRNSNVSGITSTANHASTNTVVASYRKGRRYVRVKLFEDTTTEGNIDIIQEWDGAAWVTKTTEWTLTSIGIAEKTFDTDTIPDIKVIFV